MKHRLLSFALCAAFVLGGALSARAANPEAMIQTADGQQLRGEVRWLAADKVYVFSVKQQNGTISEKRFKEDDVLRLQVREPAEFAKLKQQAQKAPDSAIAPLMALAGKYKHLQWDAECGALVAQIHLRKGNAKAAVDACRQISSSNKRAEWDSAMAPFYWQALIEANQTGSLPSLLEKGTQSANREVAAQACLKRGDMFDHDGRPRDALKDGYLRVVFLFPQSGARAEAIYKAAQMFDQLHQSAYSEKMRKLLLDSYGSSQWARKLSSGD